MGPAIIYRERREVATIFKGPAALARPSEPALTLAEPLFN